MPNERSKKVLFTKPPDRFLENEFVYQQLGPHFLQSYLAQHDIQSDILILYEATGVRDAKLDDSDGKSRLEDLQMLLIKNDRECLDIPFDKSIFGEYDIIGASVMSPQASDAYQINGLINMEYPAITTVIGGAHARYYQNSVGTLPDNLAYDFIVPHDGWRPIYEIVTGKARKGLKKSQVISDAFNRITDI